MNTRTQLFEFSCDPRQIEDVTASILHTVLFHRSLGKFSYKEDGLSYSMASIGYQDVDCTTFGFTYVSCTSVDLNEALNREIGKFAEALRVTGIGGSGQMSLEFYQKKRNPWPFAAESISWEVWTVRLNLVRVSGEVEREALSKKVEDSLLHVTDMMNRNDYTPKTPNRSELGLVFDTSFPDVQPYLFKTYYMTSSMVPSSPVGNAMKKIFKKNLSM